MFDSLKILFKLNHLYSSKLMWTSKAPIVLEGIVQEQQGFQEQQIVKGWVIRLFLTETMVVCYLIRSGNLYSTKVAPTNQLSWQNAQSYHCRQIRRLTENWKLKSFFFERRCELDKVKCGCFTKYLYVDLSRWKRSHVIICYVQKYIVSRCKVQWYCEDF